MITNSFESGFEDLLEAICGVISILPAKYIEDDQNRNILSDMQERITLMILL